MNTMRAWISSVAVALFQISVAHADGAIDFSKAPDGGVYSLRECAQTPLDGNGYGYDKVWTALGCSLISVRLLLPATRMSITNGW
jgi:hypothetical protein